MAQDNLLLYPIVSTFRLALGYGVYQWFKAHTARLEHHHSVQQRQGTAAERMPATSLPQQATVPRDLGP